MKSIYLRERLINVDRVKCIALKCLYVLGHYCSNTQCLIRKKNVIVTEMMINNGSALRQWTGCSERKKKWWEEDWPVFYAKFWIIEPSSYSYILMPKVGSIGKWLLLANIASSCLILSWVFNIIFLPSYCIELNF